MKTTARYRIRMAWCVGLAALSLGLPGVLRAQEQDSLAVLENDQCVVCHLDLGVMPEGFMAYDVHLQEGLSCAGCHGGDATVDDAELAKAPGTGFVGVPTRQELPDFCGKCHSDPAFMRAYQPRIHTDQVEQYLLSGHGQRLQQGDDKVAECASCHTAHGILPASDARSTVHALNVPSMCNQCHGDAEYMSGYGLRTSQYQQYAESVHGQALLEDQDLGAPACNDCHGNHGALPPEISSLAQMCGTCHVNNAQFFAESAMAAPFEEDELHACIECHGDHDVSKTSDEMVGIGDTSICMDCHSEGEDAYDVAARIYDELHQLVVTYDSASVMQERVARIGMDDVPISYLLKESHQSLIRARTLVHTFDADRVGETTEKGVQDADSALALAWEQIDEHGNRRLGFGLASLFITLLAVSLYLKIRDMERS